MEQVYIFDFGDKIKAGYSTNVKKRLRTIELSSGVKAKQVYSVDAGRKEEWLLHSWLNNRLEGEFFAFPFDNAKQILDDIISGKILKTPWEIEKEKRKLLRVGKVKTEAQKKAYMASKKYKEKNIKRVPLDMQVADYEALRAAADHAGEKVNQYIKTSIRQRMEREAGE